MINLFGAENSNPIIVYASLLLFVLCLALPPSMYLYLVSLVKSDKEESILQNGLKHYAPALVLLFVNTVSYIAMYNLDNQGKNYALMESIRTYANFISLLFIFFGQVIFYIYLSTQLYRKRKVMLMGSQGIVSNNTLTWMRRFLISFSLLIAVLYLVQLSPLTGGKSFFRIMLLTYICFIVYYGNKNHEYVLENIKDETLDEATRERLLRDLKQIMQKEKPFLNNELTIHSLAQQLNTNTKYLSYLINKEFDQNFNSYINTHRIEEAKLIFSGPDSQKYTIEAIAEMIGFKSKSTFNSAFKRYTEMTPSSFRSIKVKELKAGKG